jgi:hypothetical protein
MNPLHITEHEARKELLAYVDIDDLALLLSKLAVYQDRTVVVKGTDKESYACWNGYMSDERGDLNCFTDKEIA